MSIIVFCHRKLCDISAQDISAPIINFGNDLWKNKWCKFEMDAVEYYEGSQMKTKVTVKGKFF